MNVALHHPVTSLEKFLTRDCDRWVCSTVTGDGILLLPEIGVEMKLADAYADLELDTQAG